MATFGWSYKSNVCGVKRPKEQVRKEEEWQKDRDDVKIPLHSQTHSTESIHAGMKRRRYNPYAKIYVGNLNKDTKAVTLAEYFTFFGEIAYMKMIKDRETGVSRGFAFITYVEVESANKATRWCRGNHPRIDDREVKVGIAERKRRPMGSKLQDMLLASMSQKERRETHTLYWEYKWSQDTSSEVFGPYETGLMSQWSTAGYFSAGCYVRQAHPHRGLVEENEKLGKVEIEPQITSLVDSYSSSSSSEDEETPNKKPSLQRLSPEKLQQVYTRTTSDVTTPNESPQTPSTNGNEPQHTDNLDSPRENATEIACNEEYSKGSCEGSHPHEQQEMNSSRDYEENSSKDDWYQAHYGGLKPRDMFGRDSSSEDEEYECADQLTISSEFVPISEIDFSMFP